LEDLDMTRIDNSQVNVAVAGSSRGFGVSGVRRSSDVILLDSDDDSDEEETRQSRELAEITKRLKKQQIDKKPLVQYLENPPVPPPNPFSRPTKLASQPINSERINDYKSDIFKCIKHLAKVIEQMPAADANHEDFETPSKMRVALFPHQVFGTK
jgi:hypothetical protein